MSFPHRKAVIFNQEEFDNDPEGRFVRKGTWEDLLVLQRGFEQYGIEVDSHKNPTKDQIMGIMNQERNEAILKNTALLIVVVLTHGMAGGILCARDTIYTEEELFSSICCEELCYVKKVFIVQACRDGDVMGPGVVAAAGRWRNVVIARSTLEGMAALRNTKRGSLYIQAFCRELNLNRENNLITVLLRTIELVDKGTNGIQIPTLDTNLEEPIPLKLTADPIKVDLDGISPEPPWRNLCRNKDNHSTFNDDYQKKIPDIKLAMLKFKYDLIDGRASEEVGEYSDLDRVNGILFDIDFHDVTPTPLTLFTIYNRSMRLLKRCENGRRCMDLFGIPRFI